MTRTHEQEEAARKVMGQVRNSFMQELRLRHAHDERADPVNVWTMWVQMFHLFYEQEHQMTPTHMTLETLELRHRLIAEEFEEWRTAASEYTNMYGQEVDFKHPGDKQTMDEIYVEMADALGDLIVVILGTCVSMGLPIHRVMQEIMLSNFSKAGEDGKSIKRADGKVLKGPNYFKPDLVKVIGEIKEH